MTTPQLLAVDPVHGRGWRTGFGERMLPPKPFDLEAQLDDIARGGEVACLVRQSNHLLDGLWICLSRRDEVWNGMCNMLVFRDRPLSGMSEPGALFIGYASVDLARD